MSCLAINHPPRAVFSCVTHAADPLACWTVFAGLLRKKKKRCPGILLTTSFFFQTFIRSTLLYLFYILHAFLLISHLYTLTDRDEESELTTVLLSQNVFSLMSVPLRMILLPCSRCVCALCFLVVSLLLVFETNFCIHFELSHCQCNNSVWMRTSTALLLPVFKFIVKGCFFSAFFQLCYAWVFYCFYCASVSGIFFLKGKEKAVMSFQFERKELWCVCAITPQESETLSEVGKLEDPEFNMAVHFIGIEWKRGIMPFICHLVCFGFFCCATSKCTYVSVCAFMRKL